MPGAFEEHNIDDVDVEIRESVVTRSAGPRLLKPASWYNLTADIREPLTATLGLPICAQSTPWAEGTGGFFITEGGDTKRLLLVTTRHVLFSTNQNKHFERKNSSEPHHDVTLFGDTAFNEYLESIRAEIEGNAFMTHIHERDIKMVEGTDDPVTNEARQQCQRELDRMRKAIEKLNTLYQEVSTHWANPESRILGHVILSPPVSCSEGYTEDWAVIEIDASKVDASNFSGDAIDLGTRVPRYKFTLMMDPNYQNARSFMYPIDRLLSLNGHHSRRGDASPDCTRPEQRPVPYGDEAW